ncbi:hypothetical protein [Micromonospora mirobrigensis]|uniref:hypothetical protein n=1 Tax=Micromonospora mirobrigensis TaxID=262898 RepID=UPI000A736261|nr:hypothetical protein [Micromonospora mirobrigensis]
MCVLIHPCGPVVHARPPSRHPEPSMSRYVAPLGFTLAAVWVAVLFVLTGAGH